MARRADLDELRAAWRALEGPGREGGGWRTIPVTSPGSCRLLAGRRAPGGEEALLVGLHGAGRIPPEAPPQGRGFEVALLPPHLMGPMGEDRLWIALMRRPEGRLELFSMMVADLLALPEMEDAPADSTLLRRFLARIRAWQDFMGRHEGGVLSPEEELGLFGELTALGLMIGAGVPAHLAVRAWVGPLDGLQDFAFGEGALEVKSTLAVSGFPAVVSSLDQLDESQRSPLFLAAMRLALAPSGETLPMKAEAIRAQIGEELAAREDFDARLMQAGLLRLDPDPYERRFALTSCAVMAVGDGFPRLRRSDLHPAFREARYRIDLEQAGALDAGLAAALEILGAL